MGKINHQLKKVIDFILIISMVLIIFFLIGSSFEYFEIPSETEIKFLWSDCSFFLPFTVSWWYYALILPVLAIVFASYWFNRKALVEIERKKYVTHVFSIASAFSGLSLMTFFCFSPTFSGIGPLSALLNGAIAAIILYIIFEFSLSVLVIIRNIEYFNFNKQYLWTDEYQERMTVLWEIGFFRTLPAIIGLTTGLVIGLVIRIFAYIKSR